MIFLGLEVCYHIYQVFSQRIGPFTQRDCSYPGKRQENTALLGFAQGVVICFGWLFCAIFGPSKVYASCKGHLIWY